MSAADDLEAACKDQAEKLTAVLNGRGVPAFLHWDRSPWGVRIPLTADDSEYGPALYVLTEGTESPHTSGSLWHGQLGNFPDAINDVIIDTHFEWTVSEGLVRFGETLLPIIQLLRIGADGFFRPRTPPRTMSDLNEDEHYDPSCEYVNGVGKMHCTCEAIWEPNLDQDETDQLLQAQRATFEYTFPPGPRQDMLNVLEAEFEAAGGRGVELAERIDELKQPKDQWGQWGYGFYKLTDGRTVYVNVYGSGRIGWLDDVGHIIQEGASATCRHCSRAIVMTEGRWIDPEATGDDSVWRETCESHDTFTAEHEPEA